MPQRRLRNLPPARQTALRRDFPWLRAVAWDETPLPSNLKSMSITVFDHWLSREEANRLLENVPPDEQLDRQARHAKFCALLTAQTQVLSFAFRRHAKNRSVFREFTSAQALTAYYTPHGGPSLRHRMFQVVLPELQCAFFEGWDDTHHFFYTQPAGIDRIREWASWCGLYVLDSPAM